MFLTFIFGLNYEKNIGILFGIFHMSMFLTGGFFEKYIQYCNSGNVLIKDLHIILLQVNKQIILRLYGYHLPLIICTIITLVFYYLNVAKEKSK